MKKLTIYKTLVLLILPALTMAGSVEKSKRIRRSFPFKSTDVVEVYAKHGDIRLENWDKDSVAFDVTIRSRHQHENDAERFLDETDVIFTHGAGYISARTDFGTEENGILSSITRMAETITSSKRTLSIDYTLYLPRKARIELENKFGNVYLANHAGRIQLRLSHGDVKAGNLADYLDLSLSFGDFNGQEITRLNLRSEYADIVLFKVDNADINSKSSKINIQEVNRLRSRSKRDDFSIYKAGSINSDGSYTDFVITVLEKSLYFTGKYGDVIVHNVNESFENIKLNCEHSNASFNFPPNAKFALDVHLEEGDFSFPPNLKGIQTKELNEEEEHFYGQIGGQGGGSVEIFGQNTDVNLTIN